MSGMTLIEALKLGSATDYRTAVISLFARSSDILMNIPFENIAGNSLAYNREEALPNVGFRGVNEAYSQTVGVLNPQTEVLTICGGEIDVDNFIVETMGADRRAVHEAAQIKALAGKWTKTFLKGDNTTDPKEFSGLQSRIVNDQVISAGTTANGAALSLAKLDELIDAVDQPTHLVMNKTMARRLSQAARNSSVGGYITYELDAFGRRVTRYGDLPILIADKDNTMTDILPFNEAAVSGTSTATSIYCVSMGGDGLIGIQNGGIRANDLGQIESKPAYRSRVEWYNGVALFRGTAAARLQHIGDLAVTA